MPARPLALYGPKDRRLARRLQAHPFRQPFSRPLEMERDDDQERDGEVGSVGICIGCSSIDIFMVIELVEMSGFG